MVGLDTDTGREFINHALIRWVGERDIYFTRSRPYKSNDNAHVAQALERSSTRAQTDEARDLISRAS